MAHDCKYFTDIHGKPYISSAQSRSKCPSSRGQSCAQEEKLPLGQRLCWECRTSLACKCQRWKPRIQDLWFCVASLELPGLRQVYSALYFRLWRLLLSVGPRYNCRGGTEGQLSWNKCSWLSRSIHLFKDSKRQWCEVKYSRVPKTKDYALDLGQFF